MTKEQIQQAAKAAGKQYRETHLSQYNSRYQEHGENDYAKGFEAGVTSPEAKAYHGQGWVSVDIEPEKEGKYLCCKETILFPNDNPRYDYFVCEYSFFKNSKGDLIRKDQDGIKGVWLRRGPNPTHWQPPPSHPNTEK